MNKATLHKALTNTFYLAIALLGAAIMFIPQAGAIYSIVMGTLVTGTLVAAVFYHLFHLIFRK